MEEKLVIGRWAEANDEVIAFIMQNPLSIEALQMMYDLLQIIYELENERDQLEADITQMKANTQWR